MEARFDQLHERIKVLVVDDSPTVRLMLCRMLEADPGIHVVGTAANGEQALVQVEALGPDLVTMDVNMPVMDGLTAIEKIMGFQPVPILVVSSVIEEAPAVNGARALGAGAVDIMSKPAPLSPQEFTDIANDLRTKVRLLSKVKVITHPRARLVERRNELAGRQEPERNALGRVKQQEERKPMTGKPLVAIASSTGGPQALYSILQSLPGDLDAGIVVVQHIAEGFTDGLVSWLNGCTKLRVRKASDGEEVKRGDVVIAPDGIHLIVTPGNTVRLVNRQVPTPHKPSADVMLESVAEACGSNCTGIILTGMGRDGARGIKAIRDAGGHTIAQDEESSVIFSMAREAIKLGGVEEVVPLNKISKMIVDFN